MWRVNGGGDRDFLSSGASKEEAGYFHEPRTVLETLSEDFGNL
jgi:hypothetical protein